MKIRTGFVSNSSSSSFIVAGNNVMNILKKNENNNQIVKNDYCEYTVGEITKEMISQCKNSTVEMIKDIINNLVYQTASAYCTKCFIDITGAKCCCYDWDNTPENEWCAKYYENTIFDINDEMKNFIKNGATNIFKKNKKAESWDFQKILYDAEFEKISLKITENIYKEIKSNNKEIYAMSFGDNHGACEGEMGGLVEGYYLGDNQISRFLKSDFNVYCLSCH